jgi:hypothetical protein
MRGWPSVLLLAGCDAVFGLHDVPTRDAQADASVIGRPISGSIYAMYAHNGSDGQPMLDKQPLPSNTLTLTLESDTGSTLVAVDPSGAFSFVPTESPYRLALQAADLQVYELVLSSAATLDIPIPNLTRPDAAPVAGAQIELDTTPFLLAPVLVTSGIWQPSIEMAITPTSTWDAPYPQTFDATKGDRLFAIEYQNDPYATVYPTTNHITYVAAGNTTTVISSSNAHPVITTMASAATPSCIAIDAKFEQGLGRLQPLESSGDEEGHEWAVGAFASNMIAPTYQAILLADDQLEADGAGGQALVFNPFGLPTLAVSAVAIQRNYQGTNYGAAISEFHEITIPSPAPCAPGTVETFDTIEAAIAGIPTLGGKQLASDGVVVDRAGAAFVELSWQPSAQPVDGWSVELDEIGVGANLVAVHTINTTATSLKIASSLFATNKTYSFKIVGAVGLPNAAEGNFNTATFPFAITTVSSHPFTVL